MDNKLALSIIIVSWNVKEDLADCIRSIEENPPCGEFEVIVVDNASTDGTAGAIGTDFPSVTLIANDENSGFAAANNAGTEKSQGTYVLLLNPDTIVHPGSLDALIKFMDDNHDVGACGPKLLNSDGTTQPSARRFPTLRGILHYYTILRVVPIFRSEYRKWHMRDFKHDKQMDVDQVMGAALMARRSIVEDIGRMDETFFMYYEEVDLCYRIKQAGWRIVFTPDAVITHRGGRSTDQIPVDRRMMALRSVLTFIRKHRGKRTASLFNIIFKPAVVLQNAYQFLIGILVLIYALFVFDSRKREEAARKVGRAAVCLFRYSWQILFRF
jgi:hypothetical protein